MSETNDRRPARAVIWFLILAFGPVWALWSVLFLPAVREFAGLRVALLAIGMWGPGVAAILVSKLFLHESLRTTTIDRLGRKWYYLWAWLMPVVATAATVGLTMLFGIARYDPELTWFRSQVAKGGLDLPAQFDVLALMQVVVVCAVLAPLFNCLFALGEELGWRGFLLPKLMEAGWSQWQSLVLSGVIWGLWHAPAILIGHNYPDHPQLGVLLMTVFCVFLGILFGWLQLASGSVWAPTLAHGTINAVATLPWVVLTPCDRALGGTMTSVVGWIPLVLLIGWLIWAGHLPVRMNQREGPHEVA